ncbi:MAG: DMT family transporter [Planctomycetes bacterium]|nr:DMT family transporter [Planctomycetota bacterium]MBI3835799.1 DMT family transporter [Planctomycetota bacterium]
MTKQSSEHVAVMMLLLACALWGMSFNWNKTGQARVADHLIQASGDASASEIAPAVFIGLRFAAAAILWACVFPRSVRNWSKQTLLAGICGGTTLSIGILFQHYGLWYTSESLSAFLTSLTVLFTPLIAAFVLRQRVGSILWVSIVCATLGVALMTIYRAEGHFDRGAFLGLLCAVVFSVHMLIVEHFGRIEDSARFTLAQLIVGVIIFAIFSTLRPGRAELFEPRFWNGVASDGKLLRVMAMSTVFATIFAFGLMFKFQPRISATRAALVYLTEPLFATAFAWVMAGSKVTSMALLGGALIIASNVIAEIFGRSAAGTQSTGTEADVDLINSVSKAVPDAIPSAACTCSDK